jgi:hypothetical protein
MIQLEEQRMFMEAVRLSEEMMKTESEARYLEVSNLFTKKSIFCLHLKLSIIELSYVGCMGTKIWIPSPKRTS